MRNELITLGSFLDEVARSFKGSLTPARIVKMKAGRVNNIEVEVNTDSETKVDASFEASTQCTASKFEDVDWDRVNFNASNALRGLADFFVTVDAINKLDVRHGQTKVSDKWEYTDYRILKAFEFLIRPAIVSLDGVVAANGRARDLLGNSLVSIEGLQAFKAVSPQDFELAQFDFLQALDRKIKALKDAVWVNVERKNVALTAAALPGYVVIVDDECEKNAKVVSETGDFIAFELIYKFYDDRAYVLDAKDVLSDYFDDSVSPKLREAINTDRVGSASSNIT